MALRFSVSTRQRVFLSLGLGLNMACCLAAPDGISEKDYLQELPVVLSVSRLAQPLSEAPNAVTVIDRAMIKVSGFRKTVDLFNLVPGMYVEYLDGYTPLVSYHGAMDAYTRRMQVLVDGRSVYLPPYNSVDWEDLPLQIDDIERIEVVRGPSATSYGTNSILGVINIITRDASSLHGAEVTLARGNGGNAGIADAAAHFGGGGERWDYRLTVGQRSDRGFAFPPGTPTYFNIEDNSSVTSLMNLRGNYRATSTDSLDFQLGFSSGGRMTGYSGSPVRPLSPFHQIKTGSAFQQMTWLHTLDSGGDFQLRYNHITRDVVDDSYSYVAGVLYPQPYLLSNGMFVERHDIETQHTLQTSQSNRLTWGVGVRYDSINAPSYFSAPQSQRESRLFVHDEWHIRPSLVLNSGFMLENDGMGHRNTSPRAELNFHLTPNHTVRAGASVAYRTPSLFEQNSNQRYYLPNPVMAGLGFPDYAAGLYQQFLSGGGLRPERALSREIGYLGKFDNGFSVDARVYNDQVSDVIWTDYVLAPGSIKASFGFPLAWGFRNEFAAHYTGEEGTLKYNWDEGRHNLVFNFAHQKVSCDPVGTPTLGNHPLLGAAAMAWYATAVQAYVNTVPLNTGSLMYSGKFDGGFSFSTAYYQQSSVTVLDANNPQPLNRRVDMRLGKQFGPAADKRTGGGEVALVVQNAFQSHIVGYSGYVFNRRAYLTATLNF